MPMPRLSKAWAWLLLALPGPAAADDLLERGAYLTAAAGCMACHTDSENDGAPYAGGHALESPYGVFYTPNITPDMETGIGQWTEAEFVTAVQQGRAPDGSHYYPAFPYPSYAGMEDEDATAIYAYLQSIEPVAQPSLEHELSWYIPGRWAMRIWSTLFSPWSYAQPAEATAEWQRGAYLVRHMGHCGECHTARNLFGALRLDVELAGSPKDSSGRSAPDISNRESGIGGWSDDDLIFFLELGMTPEGDFVGGSMTAVVDENTALLTDADRQAIVTYLRSLASD